MSAIYDHDGIEQDPRDLDIPATETSRHRAIRRGASCGIRPDEHGYVRTGPGECDYYVEYDGGWDE